MVNRSRHFLTPMNPPMPRTATTQGTWGGIMATTGARRSPPPKNKEARKERQVVDRGRTRTLAEVLGKPKRDMVPSMVSGSGKSGKGFQNPGKRGRFFLVGLNIPFARGCQNGEGIQKVKQFGIWRQWAGAGLVVWCLGLGPGDAAGQEGPFAFQIKGGSTFPLSSFRDKEEGREGEARSGPSFAMGFTFPFYRIFGGYLGFSQHRFSCDRDICPEGYPWVSTGFDIALRVVMGETMIRPWVQAGLHTNRIEGRVWEGQSHRDLHSKGGGGYEVGAGLLVQIAERMSLNPGIRYGSGDVPFWEGPMMELRYLVFDLGLVVGF